MLRVSLLGNMGGDPEVRFTARGTQIVNFSAAVNQVRTGPDGERQENTEWFRVRVTGRQVDFVQKLGKGTRVLVFGRLDISHYQGKDGEQRVGYDVWADDVQALSARPFAANDADPGRVDSDPETLEPALAGVSSIDRPRAANGRPARGPSPQPAAKSEELEDLPF